MTALKALLPHPSGVYLLMLVASGCLAGCTQPAWHERGPELGGRLSAIVASPSNVNLLLVASPGGGVWRSTNGGASWTFPAHYGTGDYSFTHLEWDVVTPGRLYGLSWNGLHATTDNGDSWTALINSGGIPAPLQADEVAIADPKPFAQMKFSPGQRAVFAALPCSGLYYSFDGTSFTQHWPFPGGSGNLDNCIGTLAADPIAGRVYFSTLARDPFSPAHVFRSDCGATTWAPASSCLTWQTANGGLPSNSVISTLISAAAPGAGDRLVALTTATGSSTSTYLTVNGTTWTLQSTVANSWTPRTLVYSGSGQELLQGNVLASYTSNFGASWSFFTVPSEHPDTRGIYADAAAGRVWTVTDGSGQAGNYANVTRWNWTPGTVPVGGVDLGHAGLKVWQAYYAGIVPTTSPRRVFLGSQDNGSICSDSLGLSGWTHAGAPPTGGDAFAYQGAPSDPNRAYGWANDPFHFERTSNAASPSGCASVTWTQISPTHSPPGAQLVAPRHWSRNALAVHPTNPDRLYFALSNGVGVSANAGAATVLVTHRALPNNYAAMSIYVDAAGAIYAGTAGHGAYKSADDGQTWTAWGLNTSSPVLIMAIAASSGATPTFWMATTDGLYKGSASGSAWTLVTGGGGYIVNDVAVDPSCPTRVYAALGFGGIRTQHRGGIRVSVNNGTTWDSITSGLALHQGPVADVEVDPSQPTVIYAASYGRGFWVYDWGSYLPACVP